MQVWVVESGDYEQRSIDLVADSFDAAIEAIKARYLAPYQVRWDEPIRGTDYSDGITGHFDSVPGYSVAHKCHFGITAWDVATVSKVAA